MKVKLTKHNKKTTDVALFEIENNLLRLKEGKLGKPISFSSTSNCGSNENALIEMEKLIKAYQEKGFVLSDDECEIKESEIFDKAKWHYEGDFPEVLKPYQAYIHTGFYIGWLILNDLISDEFKSESKDSIQDFLNKKITCVKIYEEQLDGVFTSNDVNEIGFRFTKSYFDFDKGQYLSDYEETLAVSLPTMFHVEDTWENFDKICKVIDERYKGFRP